ncbi:MurR/RpiR family transcriptional regulator [Lysinibacillus telephonicus]|uniref:MurR/RpiR family transcriptional regulator n=1 Tax=Lysinibacillus telephonicus TaxID=1714840 RepID=A0A3S0HLT2_9BACI|nr:MurR/RpiR family transcriptional regulator [Lysinibacillus telephonicus]RTQ92450.1 MurR/RpiR family transcriptional regulator [Lysinibacillus telephonicus]
MGTIKERIEQHYNSLSKSQQKVANFVLNNPTYVGVHSAAEVGKLAGTSETTVIRFCYAIGLNGYAQLQKELTMYLFENNTNSTLGNYVSSKEELFKEQQLCEKVMGQTSAEIVRIAKQIDLDQFHETTKKFHEAKNIYLVGEGASSFAAQWFQFTLNMLRPNVRLVQTETGMLIRTLQEVDETSLAIVISLHRYYKEPIQITEEFVKRGVYTVAITDSNVAPIHAFANESFVLQQTELSTIDMMPALISFLNTLVVGMMSHDVEYYNQQRVKFDDFQNSFIANRWS